MKFDVCGRFQIEARREAGRWVAHRLAPDRRMRIAELAIPGEIQTPHEIARYRAIWTTCITRPRVRVKPYPSSRTSIVHGPFRLAT